MSSPSLIADCGSEELFMDMLLQNFPKTKRSYDTVTMALILAPSFAAVICNDKVHLPTLMSDLITLALVAWVVRFLSNWPVKWVKHLQQVRASLLNFVNSVKIEIGQAFFLPEMALNRRVFVSNLVVARRLVRLEQLAWLGGIIGTLLGAGLLVMTRSYLITSTEYRSEVFSNSTIALYVVWNLFKLALQYLDSVKSSISFTKTTSIENAVTENNLQYYIDMFCLNSNVDLPTMSPKKGANKDDSNLENGNFTPKRRNSKGKSEAKSTEEKPQKPAPEPKRPPKLDFKRSSRIADPLSRVNVTEKPEEEVFRELSIFLTPFPLKGSGLSFKKKEILIKPPADSHANLLSPIAEDLEVASQKSDEAGESTSKHLSREDLTTRVSVTGVTIPENSDPSITRLQFREWHLRDIESCSALLTPLLPSLPVRMLRVGEKPEPVGRIRELTEFHSKKVQKDWDEVRDKLTALKESCYESAWQYAEEMGNADWSEVFTLWFLVTIILIAPMRLAAKLAFLFFKLPFMVTKLYISVSLYIPLVVFKIAVVAPTRLLVGFLKDPHSGEIGLKEYRVAHSLPMLKDQLTVKLIRRILKLLHVEAEDARVAPSPVEIL